MVTYLAKGNVKVMTVSELAFNSALKFSHQVQMCWSHTWGRGMLKSQQLVKWPLTQPWSFLIMHKYSGQTYLEEGNVIVTVVSELAFNSSQGFLITHRCSGQTYLGERNVIATTVSEVAFNSSQGFLIMYRCGGQTLGASKKWNWSYGSQWSGRWLTLRPLSDWE